ncbi:MAG: ABC transporter ATP-binding protein [Gemmatimonadaceae bacterium]
MTAIEAIRIDGVRKAFGPVLANCNASLSVATGEIHAVVGENGAGKSTLMRMLAGLYRPDGGHIAVNGRDVTGWNTRDAIAAGVGMVHQHFMLVPTLTVAENLVLGQEPSSGMQLDVATAERAVRTLSDRTGLVVDPRRKVSELTIGEAQRVEILKVLYRGARILILDEPTAVLSPPEVRELWSVLRRLASEGGTVVLITHKLDEVIEISQRITVMRAGETVGAMATAVATPSAIARMMVGRDVRLAGDSSEEGIGEALGALGSLGSLGSPGMASRVARAMLTERDAALTVRDLVVSSARKVREVAGVSFTVAAGEILGIAGVEGNGQTELVEAIAGLRAPTSGSIHLGTHNLSGRSVHDRAELGLSHIPEDRHRRGLLLDYSIADNLILGLQHRFSQRGVIDRKRVQSNAATQIAEFDIRPPSPALPASTLSGGNQQKVVVAREMRGRPFSLLLASQPTRGVDVGAIEFIHSQLRAARDAGKGVLLVSADLVEVLALSDRVAVMYKGEIVVVLARGDGDAATLGTYMTGAHRTGSHEVQTPATGQRSERLPSPDRGNA